MASTPMDIDRTSSPSSTPALNITRTIGANVPSTTAVSEVIGNFKPTKLFHRQDIKEGRPRPHILSIDYDDPGELCMTAESDETIQIYKVKEGKHDKSLLSKKYGVKLARFTHTSSSIVFASTKQNDTIRYLATHDNSFIRYFEGHSDSVTSLTMHPGADNFISCSRDNTARLWAINTNRWTAQLMLASPYLSAYDPSGTVFAIASSTTSTVSLYDHRNYSSPFSTFDVAEVARNVVQYDAHIATQGWTKLEFSNDGKSILLGSRGNGHIVLDAFDGSLKGYLRKPEGGTKRAAPGEGPNSAGTANGSSSSSAATGSASSLETSSDCCFSPDGRYVLSGSKRNVLVWDLLGASSGNKVFEPVHTLEDKREASVVAFNPRFNIFATADTDLMFWMPDPHA